MFNLGSFVLGLCACALGLGAVAKRGCCRLSMGSLTCCALALLLQILEIRRRVALADWSALLDTIPAVTAAAALLLAVTVLLNFLALVMDNKKR